MKGIGPNWNFFKLFPSWNDKCVWNKYLSLKDKSVAWKEIFKNWFVTEMILFPKIFMDN